MNHITTCLFIILCLLRLTIGWKAILDRYEALLVDEKYVTINNAEISKYNRTTKAFSIDFEINRDLPEDGMIEIKFYGLLSNRYRELPLVITRKICDILNLEYQWIKSEIQGHFFTQCPILKGKYNIKDYVVDVRRFPKKPWNINNYMLHFKFYRNTETVAKLKFYAITTDDDEYSV